jgi:hypothetical protein
MKTPLPHIGNVGAEACGTAPHATPSLESAAAPRPGAAPAGGPDRATSDADARLLGQTPRAPARPGTEPAAPRWRLVRVYDVRPVDFQSGKRLPVAACDVEMLPECNRCGRRHAKVYVVQDREAPGRLAHVGSGCCKRAFGGWEPTAAEIKSARAEERARLEAAREAKVRALAEPIVAAMAAVTVPAAKLLETRPEWPDQPNGRKIEIWGSAELGVHVRCFGTFDEERRRAYENGVRRPTMDRMLADVPKTLWSEVYHMVAKLQAEGAAARLGGRR